MISGKIFGLFFALLVCSSAAAQNFNSQNSYDDDPFDSKSFFMSGFNYLSNNVYLGRKDTLVIPYYSPYVGYHFSSGFYAKGMVSYTSTGGGHIDLTTIEAGYDHSFTDYLNGGINLDKFFYNKNSLSIRANTRGSGGIYAQFNNKILEPQVTFDIDINGQSKDYVARLVLDHDFKLADNSLHIIPTFGFSSGTQNYYDEYFVNRLNKKDKKNKIKSVITDPSKMVPLVYEFSIKGTYMVNKWLFSLIPTYSLPLSPATITINKKTSTEKLSNSFFIELDICHR